MACESLESADSRQVEIAHAEYEDLVDEFAAAFGEYVAPQQLEAAKQDPEYLLRLIELARSSAVIYCMPLFEKNSLLKSGSFKMLDAIKSKYS